MARVHTAPDGDRRPRLVVFAGLPGVGKSTLAMALARTTGAVWLRVDTIEAGILKAGLPQSFETGLAGYLVARDIALDALATGRDVVIDAVNGVPAARSAWEEVARTRAVDRRVIEVVCSDLAEHRLRIETRTPPTPPLPAPTWKEVRDREYVPWDEPLLRIEGTEPEAANLERILAYLGWTGT